METVGGFELKICNNGRDALANAVSYAPDLLLFDVIPKPFDPMTLAEQIKTIWQAALCRVTFYT